MTEYVIQAGVKAYRDHQGDTEALVVSVYKAMENARNKEALQRYHERSREVLNEPVL